ncbi:MAG: KH domain-containing protein [Candidatus Marsarchaeota archaeon]|nr:KH domain-containing protein [Candidatus Marsarchaeota archaeon]
MKKIVLPGDLISEGDEYTPNTYTEGGKIFSAVAGMCTEDNRVVPLEGSWTARTGDIVIGTVTNVGRNGTYEVELEHFMKGMLMDKFGRTTFIAGDVVEAIVERVENRRTVILTKPRRLHGGTVIEVKPSKIPRIIGKNNSMIKQISEITKSNIVAGENGIVWIKGGDTGLAVSAVQEIERSAHISGLTDIIQEMLLNKGN